MNKTFQKVSVWFGVLAAVGLFAGMLVAGIFPPLSPAMSGPEVQAFTQEHVFGLRLGGLLMLIAGAFSVPFIVVVFLHLRRMEGTRPLGAYGQLVAGTVNVLFYMLPGIAFVLFGFRPEHSPEVLYAFFDIAFMSVLLPWTANAMQAFCTGMAILGNPQVSNVYPRWLGFLNIWVSIGLATGSVIPFFKSGPFAWNGLVGFWVPATLYGIWMMALCWETLKAIDTDDGK